MEIPQTRNQKFTSAIYHRRRTRLNGSCLDCDNLITVTFSIAIRPGADPDSGSEQDASSPAARKVNRQKRRRSFTGETREKLKMDMGGSLTTAVTWGNSDLSGKPLAMQMGRGSPPDVCWPLKPDRIDRLEG